MANNKQRYINTRFWNDGYVSVLDPIEKLLFIYFLTNEHTNISGIYEVPLKIIGIETGIDISMLDKIIPRLKDRIIYLNGYVIIRNFIKHQETTSVNVKKGILNCLEEINQDFLKNIVNKGFYHLPKYYADTLCIPYIEVPNYLDSNLDLDLDSKYMSAPDGTDEPVIKKDDLFEKFWEAYPKRELKKKTQEIWKRKNLVSKLSDILAFIEKAKQTDRWKKNYIKQPPAFLNGECWNDDLTSYGGFIKNDVFKNNTGSDSMIEKLAAKTIKANDKI